MSGRDEWYTPVGILERARQMMGAIDLDPASSALANETVRAGRYIDELADGLSFPWFGRVFVNPPYCNGALGLWSRKIVDESQHNVDEMIAVIPSRTDARYWHHLAEYCAALVITSGRLAFVSAYTGESAQRNGSGTTLFYFGRRGRTFDVSFGDLGFVVDKQSKAVLA